MSAPLLPNPSGSYRNPANLPQTNETRIGGPEAAHPRLEGPDLSSSCLDRTREQLTSWLSELAVTQSPHGFPRPSPPDRGSE